jgi:hypothetical protein
LDSVWAAVSPPDEVSVYMRVITHAWMYLTGHGLCDLRLQRSGVSFFVRVVNI